MLFLIGRWELQEGGPQKAELDTLDLGLGNFGPGGHCPAEFSSNPNQTYLNKLINVFKTTRKLQAGLFD